MAKTARLLALEIKDQIDRGNGYSNIVLAAGLSNQQLSPADKALVTELVSGSLRRQGTIDWLIAKYSSTAPEKMPRTEKNILRLAVYQLLFIDNIPDYAAINEAVEQAKNRFHRGMASFTNGLLRAIAKNKDSIPWPDRERFPAEFLSVKNSHPLWLIERWISELGVAKTEKLCEINNERPLVTLRTNTLKLSRSQLLERLALESFEAETGKHTDEAIYLKPSLVPYRLLNEGLFYIQNESSILVGDAVDPKPGDTVIDLCAAPGGKTTHLAQLMANRGEIVAVDINPKRLKLVSDNCDRLGIKICTPVVGDATKITELPAADRVLVDAPCSGLGVLARRPDLRWQKKSSDIPELASIQTAILDRAATLLKKGGRLIYAVCTVTKEETVQVADNFLKDHHDFDPLRLDRVAERVGITLGDDRYHLQIWPDRRGLDGMFIAGFKKR